MHRDGPSDRRPTTRVEPVHVARSELPAAAVEFNSLCIAVTMASFNFGQPLPRVEDVFNDPDHENCKSLYATMILPAEEATVRLLRTSNNQNLARRDIIALRLVGYLLIHYALFSPEARESMENAIATCNTFPNDVFTRLRLCELGEFYFNHLIRPSEC